MSGTNGNLTSEQILVAAIRTVVKTVRQHPLPAGTAADYADQIVLLAGAIKDHSRAEAMFNFFEVLGS
jgi:hypothetical protein